MSFSNSRSNPPYSPLNQLRQAQEALAAAEAELAALQSELEQFEKQVDYLLGPLLDQLSTLDAEVQALTSQLIDLRESRLFGDRRASYTGPYFAHLPDPTITEEGKKSTSPLVPHRQVRLLQHPATPRQS